MKTIVHLIALCFVVTMIGCQTTQTASVSPGAISECGAKDGMACTKDKSECCNAAKCEGEKASMGAVSECGAKKECTAAKAECEASLGAVSECGAKAECEAKKAACEASLGAVSERKQGCGAAKSGCSGR